jgi:hypothetical protein
MPSPWDLLTPKQKRRLVWGLVIAGVSLLFAFIVGGAIFVSRYKTPIPVLYGAGTSMSAKVLMNILGDYVEHLKIDRKLRLVPRYDYDSTRAVSGGWTDLRESVTSFAGVETNNLNSLTPPNTGDEFVSMPIFRSTIAIGHNVPQCANTPLAITLENLALIFSRSITFWDDSRLLADAPCLNGVHQPIATLYRTTPSAATYVFTRILHHVGVFPPANMSWPLPHGEMDPIPGNDFMLFRIRITEYSIGYLPWSNRDPYFSIYYIALKYQGVTIEMNEASVSESARFLSDSSDAEAIPLCVIGCWPLLATSYIAMRRHTVQPNAKALNDSMATSCLNLAEAALFARWALDHVPPIAEYASISPPLRRETENTLKSLTCNGDSLTETNWRSRVRSKQLRIASLIAFSTIALLVSLGLLIMAYNEHLYSKDIKMLATVVGDDTSSMEAHLLSEIYDHLDQGIALEDHPLSLPDDDQDLPIPLDRQDNPAFAGQRFSGSTNSTHFDPNRDSFATSSSFASSSFSPSSYASYAPPMPVSSNDAASSSYSLSPTTSSASPSRNTKTTDLTLIPIVDIVIGKLIGSGSYGDVFKGKYNRKTVAVKRVSVGSSFELAQSFISECRALASLKHPHILSIIGMSLQMPYTYIISEYCKHGSLDQYMQRHPGEVSFVRRIEWMTQVADGMAHLHAKQVIHRDLKLSNLLLDATLQVKIADLGTASTAQLQKARTRGMGSIDHMAPECLEGKPYDQSCDVYSFAIVLWSLFSSMPLYPGHTMFDIISRVVNGQRPSIDFITSEKLSTLIQACWHQDPSKRPTFAQLKTSLSQLSDSDFQSFA